MRTPPDIPLTATAVAMVPTKPGGVPSPAPTPEATFIIPTQAQSPVQPTKAIGPTAPPVPTRRAEDPYRITAYPTRAENAQASARFAMTIVIGTVRQVQPSRWTTPDGQRPTNPHAIANSQSIYTPVLLDVAQYLKGVQPQAQLLLFAVGGTLGADYVARNDNLFAFREGERVLLFLTLPLAEPRELDGQPFWSVEDRYTITPNNLATNYYQTLPLQQLLDQITTALQ